MMTLHKLHAGDGYTYLTRQVAAGDELRSPGQALTDYYTATGNPPGRWMGAGAADLAISGVVREDQMRSLFGKGLHPDAEQISALDRAAGASPDEVRRSMQLGRAFPTYEALLPRRDRVAGRLRSFEVREGRPASTVERSKIEAQEARKERRPVAGYDLVFTPVKSASLLWALGDAATRQAVEHAHHEAVGNTVSWLERNTAYARTGTGGTTQVRTRGFIAAAFDHRDSRAGDPDLHTHVAISNKVRAVDDRKDGTAHWLSLDARVIHAAAVAASERYNTRLEDALARRLGVTFVERSDSVRADKRAVREIDGVPEKLIRHFSRRRMAIEDRFRELAREYRHAHGREAGRGTQLKLAQQATLETREAKGTGVPLTDKIRSWRAEAAGVIGGRHVQRLVTQCTHTQSNTPFSTNTDLDQAAMQAIEVVSAERSTWTRWNMLAEVERQMRPLRFPSDAEREAATAKAMEAIGSSSIHLGLSGEAATAPHRVHGAERFTIQETLDAEARLLEAAGQQTRYALDPKIVDHQLHLIDRQQSADLGADQRALLRSFASDSRRLVVGVGAAGSGKTTAMSALASIWQSTGRRIVPLAPSATAAAVLGDELGVRSENVHKFQHANLEESGADDWFRLRPGDLVLVDEASMVGTRKLDWLVEYARERGALVRLLGDPAQLSSVEAGGAFGLLADDTGPAELTQLRRFDDPEEASASLGIRSGESHALDYYFVRGRVVNGTKGAMLEQAYDAWAHDERVGLCSLLVATDNDDVAALNARARLERITCGAVGREGTDLADGNRAGVGDRIVTRRNSRTLTDKRGRTFVKNGDTWTVEHQHANGDLTVKHDSHAATTRLPRAYVNRSTGLAYATTVARAQGMTVDTAHALVDNSTTRENLYVATSRARMRSNIYAASEPTIGIDEARPPAPSPAPRVLLEDALSRRSAQRSATEVRRDQTRSVQPKEAPTRAPALSERSSRQRPPQSTSPGPRSARRRQTAST